MPLKLDIAAKGLESARNKLEKKARDTDKAKDTALKVTGFRLTRLLNREIRQGAPGGRKFEPLSWIARGSRTRKKPFSWVRARYSVERSRHGAIVHVGFPRSGRGALPKHQIALVEKLQAGYEIQRTPKMRRYFARKGAELGSRARRRKYYFFRKDVTRHKIPERRIIDPFWDRHEAETRRNIPELIKRKLRGERI